MNMDVTTALGELRQLTAEIRAMGSDPDSYPVTRIARAGEQLAAKFDDLDGWLSRRGSAPAEWTGAEMEDHR